MRKRAWRRKKIARMAALAWRQRHRLARKPLARQPSAIAQGALAQQAK